MGNSCFTVLPAPELSAKTHPELPVITHDPDFKWKIHGFSALSKRGALAANSALFHNSGYSWFLEVSPMERFLGVGTPYVALRLVLDRSSFKPGYTMDAVFVLSMYNYLNGTYRVVKASYTFDVKKSFSEKKCLISHEDLLKSSDEFLLDDTCIFGVEILKIDVCSRKKKPVVVQKKPATIQNLFLQKKEFIKGTYTWTINNFLVLELNPPVLSPAFEIGEHKWYIIMYPRGDQYSNNSLSLFLKMDASDKLPPESGIMIEVTLSILNQKHGKHHQISGRFVIDGKEGGWGWSNFIALSTFKDRSKGYLGNGGSSCIVKADVTIIGSSNVGDLKA